MAQHREAPAFQEYAASLMARREYRSMDMEARGLFMTMRLECWVNGSLPSAPVALAKVLGFEVDQVERALPQVNAFFVIDGDDLRCPELDNYRSHIDDIRERQSQGGKAGAEKTNRGRRSPATGEPTATPRVACESLVKPSPAQSNTTKSLEGKALKDPWVSDYERQSNGH